MSTYNETMRRRHMGMVVGAMSADYKAGREVGLGDGAAASILSTSMYFTQENVTLPWLNKQRKNYDSTKSDEWRAGYEEGFKDSAPKLDIYLKKVSPDAPLEPFHPPPNTPTGIAAQMTSSAGGVTALKWGLGIAVVAGAAYAGGRWYRRNHP